MRAVSSKMVGRQGANSCPSEKECAISLLHRGQRVGIASKEPAAFGLFAVHRKAIPGELCRFPAGARGHVQRVPTPRVGDFADDHDLFQLADATDPNLLVGGREVGGKSIPAERRLARIEKYRSEDTRLNSSH